MSEWFVTRPVAITDVETTGLDPRTNEIIEIGLLVIDQQSHQIIDKLDVKIKPEHIETASQEALSLNGYRQSDWQNAVSLGEAMRLYSEKTRGAIFCAHNVTFDWSFIKDAFTKTGAIDQMDYHRLDLLTMGWTTLADEGVKFFNLDKLASYFGIPEEPTPHRAINGARTAYEVFKKLVGMNKGFERAKVCYEQNSQQMRSLNQIMWQIPVIAMTLTGGLWYAVATLGGVGTGIKYLLLAFGAITDLFLIAVLQRVRSVMEAYLDKMREFYPRGFADTKSNLATGWLQERGVANTFCVLLGIAAVMSVLGMALIQHPAQEVQNKSQEKAVTETKKN